MLRSLIALFALILSLTGQAAVAASIFYGEFWDASGQVRTMNDADAIIAAGAPTSTFTSTLIDYPRGTQRVTRSNSTTLANFLGSDAASIVGPTTPTLQHSVFRWTGFIDLLPGAQTFEVASDDGFRLTIDGDVVAERRGQRGFGGTTRIIDAGQGRLAFELIFFENRGRTGVEFFIDEVYAAPAVVPLPASLPLLSFGFGSFWFIRRRKKG